MNQYYIWMKRKTSNNWNSLPIPTKCTFLLGLCFNWSLSNSMLGTFLGFFINTCKREQNILEGLVLVCGDDYDYVVGSKK